MPCRSVGITWDSVGPSKKYNKMAARKRILPSSDELGQMPRSPVRRTRQYPIVPGGGGPVGQVDSLAGSLLRFNKGLEGFWSGSKANKDQEGMDMLADIIRSNSVTDEEIAVEKYLKDNGKPNILHPGIPTRVVQYTGAYQGQKDVADITTGEEFIKYAQSELNNDSGMTEDGREDPRNYLEKLSDNIYSNLPNRKYVGKTAGPNWKRGYDPAVLSTIDKLVGPQSKYAARFEARELAVARKANINEATSALVKALDGEEATLGGLWDRGDEAGWPAGSMDSLAKKLTAIRSTYPSDAGRGVYFRDDLLGAVQTVFKTKAIDLDADPDKVADQFNQVLNLRHKSIDGTRGGYVFSQLQRQQGIVFMETLYNGEQGMSRRKAERAATDQTYVQKMVVEKILQSYPQLAKEHPELKKDGLRAWSDLTPENIGAVIDIVVDSEWLNLDPKIIDRVAQGNRAALFNEARRLYAAGKVQEINSEAHLDVEANKMVKQLIRNHPQYKKALVGIHGGMRSALEGSATLSEFIGTIASNIEQNKLSISPEFGVTTEAISGIVHGMIQGDVSGVVGSKNSPAAEEARILLNYYKNKLDNNHEFSDADINAIQNIINKTFIGDEDVDVQLGKLNERLELQKGNEQFYVLYDRAGIMTEAMMPEVGGDKTAWATINTYKGMTNMGYGKTKEGIEKMIFDLVPENDQPKVFAASVVWMTAGEDYDAARKEVTERWKSAEIKRGTSPEELDDRYRDNETKLRNEVIMQMKGNRDRYIRMFNQLQNPPDLTETDDESRVTALGSTQDEALNNAATTTRMNYEANVEQLSEMLDANFSGVKDDPTTPDVDESGDAVFNDLRPMDTTGRNAAVEFFTGENGDARYSRAIKVRDQSATITANVTASLVSEHHELNKIEDAEGRHEDISRHRANISGYQKQLIAHKSTYEGVPWRDLADGTANFNLDASTGIVMDIPVAMKDLDRANTIVIGSWEESIERGKLFNDLEKRLDGGMKKADLTDDDKETIKYVGFIQQFLGGNLLDPNPEIRKEVQKGYGKWIRLQRSQMIATDPGRLPDWTNVAIKNGLLKTFEESGILPEDLSKGQQISRQNNFVPWAFDDPTDFHYRGETYDYGTARKVLAVKGYNDVIAHGDFSIKTGVTSEEFFKLYNGLAAGRIASERYDWEPGSSWTDSHAWGLIGFGERKGIPGKGGKNDHGWWYKFPRAESVFKPDNVSKEQVLVIAEELALGELGYQNARILHRSYRDLDVLMTGAGITPNKSGQGNKIQAAVKSKILPPALGIAPKWDWHKDGDGSGLKLTGGDAWLDAKKNFRASVAKYQQLLESKVRSPELARAFKKLYDSEDIGVTYGNELEPFELYPLPIPDK